MNQPNTNEGRMLILMILILVAGTFLLNATLNLVLS
jgi:hypothetical protein